MKQPDNYEKYIYYGGEVKALGDGKVGGYLVRYSTDADTDLVGDFFAPDTDFGEADKSPVLYHHGADTKVGRRKIGKGELSRDDVGVWIEAQLELRDEYEQAVYEMAKAGKLGWSSGTAGHLVDREQVGKAWKITSWPLGLDASLTPTPAEPRNHAVSLKSLLAELEAQEGGSTAEDADTSEQTKPITTKGGTNPMTDIDINATVAEAVKSAMAAERAAAEAKAIAEAERAAELQKVREEAAAEARKDAEAAFRANRFTTPKVSELGFSEGKDAMKALEQYVLYGDNAAMRGAGFVQGDFKSNDPTKAAWEQTTANEGGYYVPETWLQDVGGTATIRSVVREAGATQFDIDGRYFHVPIGAALEIDYEAEEAAADDATPATPASERKVEMFGMRSDVTMSREIERNAVGGFMAYLSREIQNAVNTRENAWFLAGSGTNQPFGILTRSGVGVNAAASAITSANVVALLYSLADAYAENAVLFASRATLGTIRAFTGDPFQFAVTPSGSASALGNGGVTRNEFIYGFPVFTSAAMDAIGAGNQPLLIASPSEYFIGTSSDGLQIMRNPYLLGNTGQVVLHISKWVGGDFRVAAAAKHILQATG